ncbi:hypothetical protein [Larkinella sp.]|uniref:GAP1-N1 domain-containing protein n=1 Tax=Larkinella sp. TaxID=2034517 RepID=UPI003BAC7829
MDEGTLITAEQCYFGEMNRGHGLLSVSFDDKRLLAFLSRVTDMPVSKPADVNPGVFYGCHTYESFVIFTKTFPDSQTSRSGMVFTHAIIVEAKSLAKLCNLEAIFSLFVAEIPAVKPIRLQSLQISEASTPSLLIKDSQDALLPILEFLLSAKADQYLVIPLDHQMPALYISLWNTIIPSLRYLLTFRLSFNPNDIQTANYQLYFTPIALLPRWPQKFLYDNNKSAHNPTPHSIKLLLQDDEAAPLALFLQQLNYTINDFKSFQLCELAFTNYVNLTHISNSKLLQLLRLIIVLSPSKTDGEPIKKAVITKLIQQLDQPQVDNFLLLSLANIDFKALHISPSVLSSKVTFMLTSWWKDEKADLLQETLQRRLETQESSWWITAIDTSVEQQFNKISAADAKMSWILWQTIEKAIAYFWRFIKRDQSAENKFIDTLPKKLNKQVRVQLLPLVKKQNWFRLHASLIVQYLRPEQAIEEQIALTSTDKPSLTIIANQFLPTAFIQSAITYKNQILIEIALGLPVEMSELERDIEVENPQWQEFILAKLNQAAKQKRSISEFQSILTRVLDSLVDGVPMSDMLLSGFAETTLADLSNYNQRASVWEKLSVSVREKFLKATGSSLLEHLITTADLEPVLKEAILSLNIAEDYMRSHAKSWQDILRIFELFPSLPEQFLIDHINYSRQIDTNVNAIRLGNLIKRNNWRNCATVVYQKAGYNDSYKPALSQCLDLLDLWKRLKVKYTFSNMPGTWSMTELEWLSHFENLCSEIYEEETEIRIIWKKAGGDLAELRNKESAKVIWHYALQDLKKGKMKSITFEKLVQEMIINVPAKREQLRILLSELSAITTIR